MPEPIRMTILASIASMLTFTTPTWGQPAGDSTHTPTASLEARIARDSAGCPMAVELWLLATTDTIQGFEAVLMWDRPGLVQFRRGKSADKDPKPSDSIAAMLKPTDPKILVPVRRNGPLLSTWEMVEARSGNGLSVKIVAVAKLFGQDEVAPILPGSFGPLLTLPIELLTPGAAEPHPDTVAVVFDRTGTRLSTHRGVLFAPPRVTAGYIAFPACQK